MFGKPRDIQDSDVLHTSAFDEFVGDGWAAENGVEIHALRDRVQQVESQISSQFTSLATYAQIAQEQVELARSEAKAATERSEQRLTSLIERERADRISSYTGQAPVDDSFATEFADRLGALEQSVNTMLEWLARGGPGAHGGNLPSPPAPGSQPAVERPLAAPLAPPSTPPVMAPQSGPIAGLALEG